MMGDVHDEEHLAEHSLAQLLALHEVIQAGSMRIGINTDIGLQIDIELFVCVGFDQGKGQLLVPEGFELFLHHPLAVDLEGGLLHQIGHHLLELGDVVDVRLGV